MEQQYTVTQHTHALPFCLFVQCGSADLSPAFTVKDSGIKTQTGELSYCLFYVLL